LVEASLANPGSQVPTNCLLLLGEGDDHHVVFSVAKVGENAMSSPWQHQSNIAISVIGACRHDGRTMLQIDLPRGSLASFAKLRRTQRIVSQTDLTVRKAGAVSAL
jgi:hypothetical protein